MEKSTVTPEMLFVIKTIRLQSGLSSKDLAEKIGRSPSYLSKLEKGSVRKISREELENILENIMPGEEDFTARLKTVVRTYLSFYPRKSLYDQMWLLDLDVIQRQVEVPPAMAAYLRDLAEKSGSDYSGAEEWINSNRESYIRGGFPENEIIVMDVAGRKLPVMRIKLTPGTVGDVLDGKVAYVSYYVIQSITFALIRLERYGEEELAVSEGHWLIQECARVLEEYGISSTTDYLSLISSSGLADTHGSSSLSDTFSETSQTTLGLIGEHLKAAAEHDTVGASQIFDSFEKNFEWDAGFVMKLIGIKYYEMDDISHSMKKQFFTDLERLIERYRSMSDYERTIEKY